MAAFAEMGVHPDLVAACEQQGWLLPTPIQTEAIPLILGGGDVLGAAETGSGKTAAFALPVLQIVHETLQARLSGSGATSSTRRHAEAMPECKLTASDRDDVVAVAPDGLRCQARHETRWGGVRCAAGICSGRAYFEATVADEGLCRVGWARAGGSLDLGTQPGSYGFGGTGKKSTRRQFEDYGEPYGQDDVVGCLLDLDAGTIAFSLNGRSLGTAFRLDAAARGAPLFPAVCLKNAELALNFGDAPFRHSPPDFPGLAELPSSALFSSTAPSAATQSRAASAGPDKPTALILEPSKDLAEQTAKVIQQLQASLCAPPVRSAVFLGGEPIQRQAKQLADGVDIVTGTAGRVMDLIESGKLPTDAIHFFVLDEADRLLDTGNLATILKMFARFPKGSGTARLQVLMFSATLQSEDVMSVSARICQNPILVDLKGRDAVPESVDHLRVSVDPREDRSWLQDAPAVRTDGAHAYDATSLQLRTRENWSEGIKRLKPRILQRIIDLYRMDQCLIFCRTNFDCDNLEAFLNGIGGGRAFRGKMEKGKENPYSCLVLAGQRSMEQRREALQAFKDGDVRFLICTDVAARGLDIAGLPHLINMTLPDRSEDYIHRVGRVGRAERLGLAISLVSEVEEKVWYCRAKGYRPWLKPSAQDVKTHEEGGHTIWYNEPQLLKDIEARLKRPIQKVSDDLSLPTAIKQRLASGGEAAYGEQRSSTRSKDVVDRQAALQPTLALLSDLERQAQRTFFELQRVASAARAGRPHS